MCRHTYFKIDISQDDVREYVFKTFEVHRGFREDQNQNKLFTLPNKQHWTYKHANFNTAVWQ